MNTINMLMIFYKLLSYIFYQVYGDDMAVYNVHCLVHLANEAKKIDSLDNISAFPFENFLSQ